MHRFYLSIILLSLGISFLILSCQEDAPTAGTFTRNYYSTPVASFFIDVNHGSFPLKVNFNADSSTSKYEITNYIWDFGDGTIDTVMESTNSHIYRNKGGFRPSLKISDKFGNESMVSMLENLIEVIEPNQQIAFMGTRENYRFHVFRGSIKNDTLVTLFNLTDYDPSNYPGLPDDYSPSWSPDGNQLVFTSNRENSFSLFKMESDGSNAENISKNIHYSNWAKWSPDGTKIAFTFWFPSDSIAGIGTINPDGSDFNKLFQIYCSKVCRPPNSVTWSPESDKLAFSLSDIFLMNLDGSNVTNITNSPRNDIHPDWSPDGSRIVFSSDRNGFYELFVMDTDGSNTVKITSNVPAALSPDWSPDGNKIIFASAGNIYLVNPDGSDLVKIHSSDRNETPVWRPGYY